MGGGRHKKAKYSTVTRKIHDAMARDLDELMEYEKFKSEVLPSLRRDLKSGASAEEILAKVSALAAARLATIAMTEADNSKALGAIKDLLDRSQGKAKERKEVEHKFDKLPDDQLDALLLSKMGEAGIEDGEDGALGEEDEGSSSSLN